MKRAFNLGFSLFVICGFLLLAFWTQPVYTNQNSGSKGTVAIHTGDEVQEITPGKTKYARISGLYSLTNDGTVIEGVSVATVHSSDNLTGKAYEVIAYVPSSEKVKVGDKVILYCLTHHDRLGIYNYTRMVRALPDDYHGF